MRDLPSRNLHLALGAAVAAFVFSADRAQAQFFPPFGDRYYGYERRDDYYDRYERRRRRDMDSYFMRDPYSEPDRVRRPKRPPVEEPKAEANNSQEPPAKGPFQIVVSINKQKVALYGASGLIQKSVVSTGMRGHSTPMGVFSVIEKDYYHESNIYSGAPMPLMQRITWSGVALHQGALPGYPASHGCIRLNAEFAKFLWNTTQLGARVIVTSEEVEPVDISSPKLFAPLRKPMEAVNAPVTKAMPASVDSKQYAANEKVADIDATPVSSALPARNPLYKSPPPPPRKGNVAVFVSRKTKKLYVRYANQPLFEVPVQIERPEQPLGTHVFTAMEETGGGKGMRWNVISIPTAAPEAVAESKRRTVIADIGEKNDATTAVLETPSAALDRIAIPQESVERVSELLTPGSSLTISDYGISNETGYETEFIILTR